MGEFAVQFDFDRVNAVKRSGRQFSTERFRLDIVGESEQSAGQVGGVRNERDLNAVGVLAARFFSEPLAASF